MINKNAVYTRIANAVKAVYSTAYVTGKREPTPSKFPCVWCVESDTYPDSRYVTLNLDDEQRISVFETQVFSNLSSGATTQVSNIMAAIESSFRGMGYIKTSHTPISNTDSSIYREVARFRRIIAETDTIE